MFHLAFVAFLDDELKRRDLTTAAFCRASGIAPQTVSDWRRDPPGAQVTAEKVDAVLRGLRMSLPEALRILAHRVEQRLDVDSDGQGRGVRRKT